MRIHELATYSPQILEEIFQRGMFWYLQEKRPTKAEGTSVSSVSASSI